MKRNWAKILAPALGMGLVVGAGLTLVWSSSMGLVIGVVVGVAVTLARYNFCCNPARQTPAVDETA